MKRINDLLAYLCDGAPHPLAPPISAWLRASKRYRAFASANRDKIRKKLRETRETESVHDLDLELETAYLLLRERQFSLAYEPYGRAARSPDYAVTWTTSLTFNVEVTRLRDPHNPAAATCDATVERLADTICGKLPQLLPQMSNVVIARVEHAPPTETALQTSLYRIKGRVEQRDAVLVARYGLRDTADFIKHYGRLSAVLVRGGSDYAATAAPVLWINGHAKHPLPPRIRHALCRSHTPQRGDRIG